MGVSVTESAGARAAASAETPSYLGTLRGELFKLARQRPTWIIGAVLAVLFALPYLFYQARPEFQSGVKTTPIAVFQLVMEINLLEMRVLSGIALLVIAVLVIGLEYTHGTIRILLGRGVGRLQLLSAKVLALVVVALTILVGGLVLDGLLTVGLVLKLAGNLTPLQALNADFWSATWGYLLAALISMGATLLLAIAASVVGRSLAFGLAVALVWFPADNIGVGIMELVNLFTHNDFWLNITGYFLGPNLNALPALFIPKLTQTIQTDRGILTRTRPAPTIGVGPAVSIDLTHALLVVAGYSLVFAIVAIVLTRWRDVME